MAQRQKKARGRNLVESKQIRSNGLWGETNLKDTLKDTMEWFLQSRPRWMWAAGDHYKRCSCRCGGARRVPCLQYLPKSSWEQHSIVRPSSGVCTGCTEAANGLPGDPRQQRVCGHYACLMCFLARRLADCSVTASVECGEGPQWLGTAGRAVAPGWCSFILRANAVEEALVHPYSILYLDIIAF